MKDYQVSNHNLDDFISDLIIEIKENKLMLVTTQPYDTGKWGLARLWRAWMGITAEFMAANGVYMPLMYTSSGKAYGCYIKSKC